MPNKGEKEGKRGRQEDQKEERGWSIGEGGEARREEKTDAKKKLIPTHGLWLCASESTCSLSKGQSWSCLPETGGKG